MRIKIRSLQVLATERTRCWSESVSEESPSDRVTGRVEWRGFVTGATGFVAVGSSVGERTPTAELIGRVDDAKARRELGYATHDPATGMAETVAAQTH